MAGNDIPYQGPRIANDRAVIELPEVQQGESPAPPGTEPYVVQPGDTLYEIARDNGYGNPPDMQAFYRDNPQYAESERNPDLIWPGEVVFIKTPQGQAPDTNGDGVADPATDTDGDGTPDPVNPEQAAATTDAAATDLAEAEQARDEYMSGPGPKGLRFEFDEQITHAQQRLSNAVEAEIETGLRAYVAANPDATPEELQREAERLGHQIQGREGNAAVSDAMVDYRAQQAINTVSAEQRGIALNQVAPGTPITDGPYTEEKGPFQPNSTVTGLDGRAYRIDANGYLANGPIPTDGDSRGNARYTVYENGVPTGQSWLLPPRSPAPESPPQPAAENPVGTVAQPPTDNAERTDAAADAYYRASTAQPPDPQAVERARETFAAAVRAELATGGSLEAIKGRYGGDAYLGAAADDAAYGAR